MTQICIDCSLLQLDWGAAPRLRGVHGGELQAQPAGAPRLLPNAKHHQQRQGRLSGMLMPHFLL